MTRHMILLDILHYKGKTDKTKKPSLTPSLSLLDKHDYDSYVFLSFSSK